MSRKKLFIIIAVLVLALLIISAIIVMNRKSTPQNAKQQSAASQDAAPDPALLGAEFTDSQKGVAMNIPKGWQLAPKDDDNPTSLTKFVQNAGANGANGELLAREINVSMDDLVRSYLEAAMDIHATPDLVDNKDVRIGDKTVRLLTHEMPGPNGVKGRITQYIYPKGETYYILAFAMLASDWEAQQPGIEASVKSLKVNP